MLEKLKEWWGITFSGPELEQEGQAERTVERTGGFGSMGSRQDQDAEAQPVRIEKRPIDPKANDPEPGEPDPGYAARNEILGKNFKVYLDTNGYYQLTDEGRAAYESSSLTDAQLKSGYASALDRCQEEVATVPEEQQARFSAIFSDMALYRQVHDPAYLGALPAADRKALMEQYLEWENTHCYTNDKGEVAYCMGATAEEYGAMGETAKAEYDAQVSAASVSWGTAFHGAFDEYANKPDVQSQVEDGQDTAEKPAKAKKAGFWATLTTSAAGLATSIRSMLESSEIGKKAVEWFNGLKSRLTSFVSGKKNPDLYADNPGPEAVPMGDDLEAGDEPVADGDAVQESVRPLPDVPNQDTGGAYQLSME